MLKKQMTGIYLNCNELKQKKPVKSIGFS